MSRKNWNNNEQRSRRADMMSHRLRHMAHLVPSQAAATSVRITFRFLPWI